LLCTAGACETERDVAVEAGEAGVVVGASVSVALEDGKSGEASLGVAFETVGTMSVFTAGSNSSCANGGAEISCGCGAAAVVGVSGGVRDTSAFWTTI
jgi:hypothetical protein